MDHIAQLEMMKVNGFDMGLDNPDYEALDAAIAALRAVAAALSAGQADARREHPLDAVKRALLRFDETTGDCGETDLPRDVLNALVAFGYLTKRRAGRHGYCYTMTNAGFEAIDAAIAASGEPQWMS